jgi:hypothetical protein
MRLHASVLAAALALTACEDRPVPDIPEVAARRLTRGEYERTTRDLLGLDAALAREFPADHHALGFDTIAAVQTSSPLLVQLYRHSAEDLAAAAVTTPAARAALIHCTPDPADPRPCARAIVESFVTRAWRRPPTPAESERLLALFTLTDDFDAGVRLLVEAALLSPHFVFRWERAGSPPGSVHELDGYALAARLSYLLWSSTPDPPLMALAASDALADPDVVRAEVLRMLADPRSDGFIDGFGGQWLYFRGLDDVFRDAHRYPEFDDDLRASMAAAVRRRFAEFLVPGRDLRELLTGTEAHVDPLLADLYLIDPPAGDFTRVDLGEHRRRGLLTEPALLTVLSHPFASSPARRGRFVLEQLLCTSPGAPPPSAFEQRTEGGGATARERAEQHRADPACAGCHAMLDPIGLSFEHYDAIGRWRGSESGELIDSAGELPTGERFADVRELAALLADDPRFSRCVVEKLLIYTLGRALEPADDPTLDSLHARFVDSGHDLVELLIAAVQSDPFRLRRAQEAP